MQDELFCGRRPLWLRAASLAAPAARKAVNNMKSFAFQARMMSQTRNAQYQAGRQTYLADPTTAAQYY
jgi:hypothetical protein